MARFLEPSKNGSLKTERENQPKSLVLIHQQQLATASQKNVIEFASRELPVKRTTLVVQQIFQTAIGPSGRIEIIFISTTPHKQTISVMKQNLFLKNPRL